MSSEKNPLLCNPDTGTCELPGLATDAVATAHSVNSVKPVTIVYFTDPICSSCWGIEPQLRKLKLEYGDFIRVEYHMGGLLPDWSYNSGGISKPSDVAHHWDEVSKYYDMPIDGNVWLEDPLHSSYPPSIAFKAAQLQNEALAVKFLRRIREMVFLEKKNITRWEYLRDAADYAGLDSIRLKKDFDTRARDLFKEDLSKAKELSVRGFPTLFFVDQSNQRQTVYGYKPYSVFETALKNTFSAVEKKSYDTSWEHLFSHYPTLTAREFSELTNRDRGESERLLRQLTDEKKLVKKTTRNGAIWSVPPVRKN